MKYDLVIRGGTVVDGTGAPGERADVGIYNGRIAKIGLIRDPAVRVIDAVGHVVSPGFVDGHTHMDAQVLWDELGSSSCYHGVTTVVMGNCGFTLAPAHSDQRALVVRNLERAEDISAEALAAGIDWSWETFPEYLGEVERRPKAINYAGCVGHSALRTWAMGERAFSEPADDDDLKVMQRSLAEALKAGAIGLTTSRADAHRTSDDRPVASRLASWHELRSLVGVMSDLGSGVFELAPDPGLYSPDAHERTDSHRQLADLAAETNVPFTFGATHRWGVELLDTIIKRGGRAFGQTKSRGTSSILSFLGHMPFDVLPTWKELRARPLEEQRRLLSDASTRQGLIDEARHGDYPHAIGAEPRPADFDAMRLYDQPLPPHPTVREVAASRDMDPVDLIIQLGLQSDFQQLFIQPTGSISDDELLFSMKFPRTAMTFSDSGAHVSQISDCSIQTYLLSYWVHDRQDFSLEEAIRMVTLAPATAWGFMDRGMVREGFVADLNIFDPMTVGPELPVVTADLPGSACRLVQKARGFLATVVGGEVTLENGAPTGARPGRLLRGPLASA